MMPGPPIEDEEEADGATRTGGRSWLLLRMAAYLAAFGFAFVSLSPDRPDPPHGGDPVFLLDLIIAFIQALMMTVPPVLLLEATLWMSRK